MTVQCRVCKQPKEVSCTNEQLKAWQDGGLIQYAMPNVPADERELLISGLLWRLLGQDFFRPR